MNDKRLSAEQIEHWRRYLCGLVCNTDFKETNTANRRTVNTLCDAAIASLAEREHKHGEDRVHDSPLLAAIKLGPDWFDAVAHACGLSDVEVRAYHAALLAAAQAQESSE